VDKQTHFSLFSKPNIYLSGLTFSATSNHNSTCVIEVFCVSRGKEYNELWIAEVTEKKKK
jgi:hypothetical protein